MLKLSDQNEVIKILAEIEIKVQRVKAIVGGGDPSDVLDGPASYDETVAAVGEKGVLEMILALPTVDDKTRDFCTSLLGGLQKYKNLTDKQASALAKVYWHNFVKGQ